MNYEEILAVLPEQEADFDTCFAFSVHKCGSTMMNLMIGEVCLQCDLPAASLPTHFFNLGIRDKDWSSDTKLVEAFSKNLLYFGFRALPPLLLHPDAHLHQKRFTLLVRDPRDALVSQYFSYGTKTGSHTQPKKNAEAFIAAREATPDRTIDDYVVRAAAQLKSKLETYRDNLNFDLGLVRRYEDVFFDKETFLGEIFDHFGIEVPAGIIAQVAQKHDIRPEKEDETRHIRKGTPGDHAEKLAPETIVQLNDIFREVGAFYGYAL